MLRADRLEVHALTTQLTARCNPAGDQQTSHHKMLLQAMAAYSPCTDPAVGSDPHPASRDRTRPALGFQQYCVILTEMLLCRNAGDMASTLFLRSTSCSPCCRCQTLWPVGRWRGAPAGACVRYAMAAESSHRISYMNSFMVWQTAAKIARQLALLVIRFISWLQAQH